MIESGEQVDLAAVRAGGAAQALAVDRDRAQVLGGEILRPVVGEPSFHRAVERVAVDPRQDPADDRLAGCRMAPGQRIAPGAECADALPRPWTSNRPSSMASERYRATDSPSLPSS
ncbi:hypothetical protein [Kitasatospora sp. NPDC057936]|uniref:hypothetical protein n=1 Tax=Kitasatospora sp. NPDC057936 TaxID=3346283 RepID=UPI0036DEBCA8